MRLIKNYIKNKIVNIIDHANGEIHSYLYDIMSLNDLKNQKTRGDILIIEPNMRYHAECLPSYIKYFNDLGYKSDVVLSRQNLSTLPFCRIHNLDFNVYAFYNYSSIQNIADDCEIIKKYKKIFISTSMSLTGELYPSRIQFPHKVINVAHSIESISSDKIDKLNTNIVVLSYFNNKFNTVNPHFFGNYVTPKKNEYVNFVTVGRLHKNVKNYELMINTVDKLINNNFNKFKVLCIGWEGDQIIPEHLHNYIKIIGRISFSELYSIMEKSDFYLSLLDPHNILHRRYSYDAISGSNQLVLGFKVPFLISDIYAKPYGYDHSNAIIYHDNELYDAMVKSIMMQNDEYELMKKNIENMASSIYNKSLSTLRGLINED